MDRIAASTLGTRARIAAWSIHDRMRFPAPSHASEVPWHADAITPAWMQSALAGPITDAKALHLQILGGDDGSSCRRRLHIEWNQIGKNAGLPENVFTKSAPTFAMRFQVAPCK